MLVYQLFGQVLDQLLRVSIARGLERFLELFLGEPTEDKQLTELFNDDLFGGDVVLASEVRPVQHVGKHVKNVVQAVEEKKFGYLGCFDTSNLCPMYYHLLKRIHVVCLFFLSLKKIGSF